MYGSNVATIDMSEMKEAGKERGRERRSIETGRLQWILWFMVLVVVGRVAL